MLQRCLLLFLFLSAAAAFGTQHAQRFITGKQTNGSNNSNAASRSSLFRSAQSAYTTTTTRARESKSYLSSPSSPSSPSSILSRSVELATSLGGGGHGDVPSYPKSPDEYAFIREALLENVMFTTLPEASLNLLIGAFERTQVTKDQLVVTQGDHPYSKEGGDSSSYYVYLVGVGECTVKVDGKVVPEPYGTLKPKAIFGELGVLYNRTRAATISGKSNTVTLFRVHGDTFKSVLNSLASTGGGGGVDDDDTNDDANANDNDALDELEKIDQAINQVAGTKSLYGGDIIRQYKPNRTWLWRRWTGTVLSHNYRTVCLNMMFSLIFIVITRRLTTDATTWGFGLAPDKSHPFIQRLAIVQKLWSYQMSLTTFILTFFVNQAYSFWQDVHGIARRIQGRLNDFHLLLATSAKRNPDDGTYTRESEKLMDEIGASSRLFHVLFWASCSRRFQVLQTRRGMERMASRGLMTSKQLSVLENLDVPDNQKHNACLEWMMIRAWQGIEDGTLRGGDSLSLRLMDQMCQLRGTYATIGDKLSCRMPLPYTHFVQILVDCFVLLSPLALYAELGAYSVFCVGILTLFYTGLLDLAKVFLDPLDNEDFTKNSIDMDLGVLIRESNAGSTRWKNSGASLPFNPASV